ncbi:hypothetical protein FGG08_003914 [Glutinoglossum americanum]|uniref:Bacteriophage T5 Orf172 DNA-binding domain-containing protein n=1 Tax=Glutinoglossum americanum TaxID=1670608 RepID=A0A9P8I6C1_9PEZI|nr:hypothetical protein FGG08_003914 [Glutinoglossum americanum]
MPRSPKNIVVVEDASYMKAPRQDPEVAKPEGRDVSIPRTPSRTRLRPESRHKPCSTSMENAPAQPAHTRGLGTSGHRAEDLLASYLQNLQLRETVERQDGLTASPGSPESPSSEGYNSIWGTPESSGGNTSSACTTPSPRYRHRVSLREEPSSPTTAHRPGGSSRTHSAAVPVQKTGRNTAAEEANIGTNHGSAKTAQYPPLLGRESVPEVLTKDLGSRDMIDGEIYAYKTSRYPGLIKIGYTKNASRERAKAWGQGCGYKATVLYPKAPNGGVRLPHAHRAESLIMAELGYCRKRLPPCMECARQHEEWFEIELESMVEIIEKWSLWILRRPYQETGGVWRLKMHLCNILDRLERYPDISPKPYERKLIPQFPRRPPTGGLPRKRSGGYAKKVKRAIKASLSGAKRPAGMSLQIPMDKQQAGQTKAAEPVPAEPSTTTAATAATPVPTTALPDPRLPSKPPPPTTTTTATRGPPQATHSTTRFLRDPSAAPKPPIPDANPILDRILKFLLKLVLLHIAASFILSFYPQQDSLAVRAVLLFVYFYFLPSERGWATVR